MTTRKMYADVGWDTAHATYVHSKRVHTSVPVLVTNAEGMPDFGPGDHVYDKDGPGAGSPDYMTNEVEGVYIDSEGKWCVVFTDGDYDLARDWTKLPREKTVTLRVTGPEAEVAKTIERVEENAGCGVTVEVDE